MNALNPEAEPMTCMICEETRSEGIHICGQFICADCETEMVRTDVKDEKYPFFITQMKRVWYKKDA
nr:sigma factor G inhibitor Gin [Paenibacillus antri]